MRFKMSLPGYQQWMNSKTKAKICKEPGCGREFFGHAISKYCEMHSDPRKRKRIKPKYIDVTNQISPVKCNAAGDTIDAEFTCALEGCGRTFRVKVYPEQKTFRQIVPKFCELHRNEYRRQLFVRMKRKEEVVA